MPREPKYPVDPNFPNMNYRQRRYAANREKELAAAAARYCPEKAAAANAKFRAKNPWAVKASWANSSVKRRHGRDEMVHGTDLEAIFKAQDCCCAGCKEALTVDTCDVDHWIPMRVGGPNRIENIQILCPTCNAEKSWKHPLLWLDEKGWPMPDRFRVMAVRFPYHPINEIRRQKNRIKAWNLLCAPGKELDIGPRGWMPPVLAPSHIGTREIP